MTLTLDRPPRLDLEDQAEVEEPDASWQVRGRPVEDRSFEAVETTAGAVVGLTVGMAVAGPAGAVIGGIVGGAVAFEAGEALERSIGIAARTTDATDEHTPPVD